MTDDVYAPIVNVPLPAIHKPTRPLDTSMLDRRDTRDPQEVWAEMEFLSTLTSLSLRDAYDVRYGVEGIDCGPDQE